jgi:hypothetical protein
VTKLRNVLAVALLMLPAVTLNATSFTNEEEHPGMSAPQTGMCWIYAMGRWWYVPC